MGIGNFSIKGMVEETLDNVNLDSLVKKVMGDLQIDRFQLFFVADKHPGGDGYSFIGLTYSLDAAKKLLEKKKDQVYDGKIFRIDLDNLISTMEKLGVAEEVHLS